MPEKDLTIKIPEPVNGKCSTECPCYRYAVYEPDRVCEGPVPDCTAGLYNPAAILYDVLEPGKECPQYQDAHAVLVKRYQELGFTETTLFPGKYTLLIHPRSLQKVRVYTTGKVFMCHDGGHHEVIPCT